MLLVLLIAQLSSAPLPTPIPTEPVRRAPVAQQRASSVSGVVHDSIARRPLVGATVQLVATDTLSHFGQTVISDSLGYYSFRDVPAGKYTLGFFHPMLDSLGIEPMMRAVAVTGERSVMTNLAIPSAATLSAAVCGAANAPAGGALLIGIVRDARTREPVSGVTVAGEWVELSIGKGGVTRRTPRRVVTTRENGWFAVCNVPSPGAMTLSASRNADSTDVVEVEVPVGGFMRRELYLGEARTTIVNDLARASDTKQSETRQVHVGDGRLAGKIVASNGAKPLANARVSIVNGPEVRTNDRGEWAMNDAPAGTRTLEVRAVGYYPTHQAVDVVAGAPSINVSLVTFKSVLDTMKVIANYDRYSNLAAFKARSRSGMGRYLSGEEIAKRNPVVTSDLFLSMPGVYIEYPQGEDGDSGVGVEKSVLMRGFVSGRCRPAIYINGNWIPNTTSTDVDVFVKPGELLGIEVYSATQVPPQFQPGLSGCGSILFWTK